MRIQPRLRFGKLEFVQQLAQKLPCDLVRQGTYQENTQTQSQKHGNTQLKPKTFVVSTHKKTLASPKKGGASVKILRLAGTVFIYILTNTVRLP